MIPARKEIIEILAENYFYFLNTIPWENEVYVKGMGEARNKFLANLHISIIKTYLPKKHNDWRYSTDFVSEKALELLKQGNWGTNELKYEHIVPKAKYIKDVCEVAAKCGDISVEFIKALLLRYFWTATIHSDEESKLSRRTMPSDWDEKNIFARYEVVDIKLIEHDKSYFLKESFLPSQLR